MQPDARELLASRTARADEIVREFAAACLHVKMKTPFSVVAVGGYGRKELFPQSDIDLLVLIGNEAGLQEAEEPLAEFVSVLWDRGLRASQSVRTLEECGQLQRGNTELHMSLLDARLVTGEGDLFAKLTASLPEFYRQERDTLIKDLAALARKRHAKYNDTVYHLEPNMKEGPGGIRDIQFVQWLQALRADDGRLEQLSRETQEAKKFMSAVRCFLHQRTKRDANLLTFELQDRIAEAWGAPAVDPAEWMRAYYRQARKIFGSTLQALDLADCENLPELECGGKDSLLWRDRVWLCNPDAAMISTASLLELFIFVGRCGFPLSGRAQRQLSGNGNALVKRLGSEKIPWSTWRKLFEQKHAAQALRQMQDAGLLTAAIPHWSAIECLVVRDFYHRYTVDEHSIVAVEAIDNLAAGKEELPRRFRQLLSEEDGLATLRLALVLHDVGKGTLPGDHVNGSLRAAEDVFAHWDVPAKDRESILFLIEHHMDLSMVMNGRDLDDPATARFLTARIGTEEDLRRLTLLTYADISAVNPTAMTPWRTEQLWRVYLSARDQLTRDLMENRIDRDAMDVSGMVATPGLLTFLRGFPKRYLRTNTRAEIEHHFELDQERVGSEPAVEIRRDGGVYLLTVLASDSAGVFAWLCGTLASAGMNILKAEAAANNEGQILDLIRFSDPMRTLELNPAETGALEQTIREVIAGRLRAADLLKRRWPASSGSRVAPSVRFSNDASEECTLMDFSGEDRPGLLYDLTSALSEAGCNIELVLVDTQGHKALDVFYVTLGGAKLDEGVQERLGEALVKAAQAR